MQTAHIVGRQDELIAIAELFDAGRTGPAGLLLHGDAGIGKTTLWKAAAQLAEERGMCVLSSRPGPAETRLTFAGLADLLSGVSDDILEQVPTPQRRALEVALIRTDQPDAQAAPNQLSIATACLSVLQTLARQAVVLVAVDDLQWLDSPSWGVLAFALRRLKAERVAFLGTRRTEGDQPARRSVEQLLVGGRLRQLRVGSLNLAALHEILTRELGHSLARPTLVRIEHTSAGNPLFALELGRAILESGQPMPVSAPLPVPATLRELIDERLGRLPTRARRAMLIASALSRPTLDMLDGEALAPAEKAGVIRVEANGQVAFSHPMLATAMYASASGLQRRALHRKLAERMHDVEEQARHLALSARGPSETIAAALENAAGRARMRGAPEAAAELLELAVRLTPGELAQIANRRSLAAAEDYFHAGDLARGRALAEPVAAATTGGVLHGHALRVLGEIRYQEQSFDQAIPLFEDALRHLRDDRQVVWVHTNLAYARAMAGDIHGAVVPARAAIRQAARFGDDGLRAVALAVSAMVDWFLGRPPDQTRLDLALSLEDTDLQIVMPMRPSLIAGSILVQSDDPAHAQTILERLRQRTIDRGAETELPLVDVHLTMVERYQGHLQASIRFADEGYEMARQLGSPVMQTIMLAERCLTRAAGGDIAGARADAAATELLVKGMVSSVADLWRRCALASLELALSNPAAASEAVEPLARAVEDRAFCDPISAQYLPDAIEAHVALGRLDRAQSLAEILTSYAEACGRHQRALASRSSALVLAAHGDLNAALAATDRAVLLLHEVPLPLELARTLLLKGQIHRRRKEKLLAREALSKSQQMFEEVGAPVWAEKAHAELRRIGLRARDPDQLTHTEQQIAQLAAKGLRNHQIADRLFVSTKTVEVNLARVYRKLGVASRAELAAHFGQRTGPPET